MTAENIIHLLQLLHSTGNDLTYFFLASAMLVFICASALAAVASACAFLSSALVGENITFRSKEILKVLCVAQDLLFFSVSLWVEPKVAKLVYINKKMNLYGEIRPYGKSLYFVNKRPLIKP